MPFSIRNCNVRNSGTQCNYYASSINELCQTTQLCSMAFGPLNYIKRQTFGKLNLSNGCLDVMSVPFITSWKSNPYSNPCHTELFWECTDTYMQVSSSTDNEMSWVLWTLPRRWYGEMKYKRNVSISSPDQSKHIIYIYIYIWCMLYILKED